MTPSASALTLSLLALPSRARERLTRAKWYGDDTDGWEMTVIQAKLVRAEGMYRTPTKTGATFMTLANVRWASPDEWYERAEPET